MASVGIQLPTVGSVWKKKKMSGAILPPPFSSFFHFFVVGMHFDISFLPSSSSNGFCSASIRFLPPPFSLFNSKLLFSFDPSDFCFCDLSLLFASLLSSLYSWSCDTQRPRTDKLLFSPIYLSNPRWSQQWYDNTIWGVGTLKSFHIQRQRWRKDKKGRKEGRK